MFYLRLACTCEETCESVWPPNASFYASSTCVHLRLLAGPFDQGLSGVGEIGEKRKRGRRGERAPAIKAAFFALRLLRLQNWIINSTSRLSTS